MLPSSCSPNSRAAWPVSWNWKLVVWWIGTATEPVVGSARWLPPCRARVSGLVQTGFDMLRLRVLVLGGGSAGSSGVSGEVLAFSAPLRKGRRRSPCGVGHYWRREGNKASHGPSSPSD